MDEFAEESQFAPLVSYVRLMMQVIRPFMDSPSPILCYLRADNKYVI